MHKKSVKIRYVVCIKNEDYTASLELRKLYAVVPDRSAAKRGLRRIIDELGEITSIPGITSSILIAEFR